MNFKISTKKVVHDYTQSMWGHALHMWKQFEKDGKVYATAMGHGTVKKGDLVAKKSDGSNDGYDVWEIVKLEYCRDPSDMFNADFRFCDELKMCNQCHVKIFPTIENQIYKHDCSDPIERPEPGMVRFLR